MMLGSILSVSSGIPPAEAKVNNFRGLATGQPNTSRASEQPPKRRAERKFADFLGQPRSIQHTTRARPLVTPTLGPAAVQFQQALLSGDLSLILSSARHTPLSDVLSVLDRITPEQRATLAQQLAQTPPPSDDAAPSGALRFALDVVESRQVPASVPSEVSATQLQSAQDFLDNRRIVDAAMAELGVSETTASGSNPRILEYHAANKSEFQYQHEDISWCASFCNWIAAQTGLEGTGHPGALRWASWGQEVNGPAYGSIAVIQWPPQPGREAWAGHVGIVVGKVGDKLVLVGGNQASREGGAVTLGLFDPKDVVAYRAPSGQKFAAADFALPELELDNRHQPTHSYALTR